MVKLLSKSQSRGNKPGGAKALPFGLFVNAKIHKIMETTKKRGGAREGAGRKKTTVRCTGFRVTADADAVLEKVDNKTDFINAAIVFYGKHQGLI